ncbi:MAG: helix-turn-helix transcriptional regulator, partial [Desulfobacteraceae bacterium]|nr:helix-turn-helix transcriptional regulator [Desulfobacteraceae bacterium]
MAKSIMKDSNKPRSQKQGHTVLTSREVEILSMVAIGFSNHQVADQFRISHHTVKRHLYNPTTQLVNNRQVCLCVFSCGTDRCDG